MYAPRSNICSGSSNNSSASRKSGCVAWHGHEALQGKRDRSAHEPIFGAQTIALGDVNGGIGGPVGPDFSSSTTRKKMEICFQRRNELVTHTRNKSGDFDLKSFLNHSCPKVHSKTCGCCLIDSNSNRGCQGR